MNDFDYDALQKKRIAQSARHRVNGSKSKKCSLPSDNLTAAQKRKLNGPVQNYAINRPMTWSAFKAMPVDLQQAHIDYIQNRFEVGLTTIGKYVFGLGQGTLRWHCEARELRYQSFQGKSSIPHDLIAWANNEGASSPVESPALELEPAHETEIAPAPIEVEPETAECASSTMLSGSLHMRGNANAVLQELWDLLQGKEIDLTVNWEFIN